MIRSRQVVLLTSVLLLGLPLIGLWQAGISVAPYLEFPPRTQSLAHAPFSWSAFLVVLLAILGTIGPVLYHIIGVHRQPPCVPPPPVETQHSATRHAHGAEHGRGTLGTERDRHSFPWWGWLAGVWTAGWWILAWTRFPWAVSFQEHTFTPLWVGYIVIVHAWTYTRTGQCRMLQKPREFWTLFPLSALYWWMFEYLNRFVQNWMYTGVGELSALEYVVRATIPFSTVLPAVIGTRDLLHTHPGLRAGLDRFVTAPWADSKLPYWIGIAVSCAGLLGLGVWPDYLFPFVWIGPLLLLLSLQGGMGLQTRVSPLVVGDWRGLWVPAVAALICGFFWELWNWGSLAHWEYALPFVHRFNLFEMPVLGYAGYLPFGLTCVVVAELCLGLNESDDAACAGAQRN